MNYHRLDKERQRKKRFGGPEILLAVCICLILVGIGYLFSSSLAQGFYSIRRAIFPSSEPIISQGAENALIVALEADNNQLKQLLGRASDREHLTLAAILVRPPQTPYDAIVIDAGKNMHLAVGDIIYAEMNYAIGRVTSVSDKTSLITLFSSSGQKENVLVGSSTLSVSAEGRGGGNFYIKIPRNISVHQGDPIIWPDIQTMLLGKVDVVDSGSGDAYTSIYFKSPINIQTLRYVQFKSNLP